MSSIPRPAECARREVYWCVIGGEVKAMIDAKHEDDHRRHACGNYFSTFLAAELAVERYWPEGFAETTYD